MGTQPSAFDLFCGAGGLTEGLKRAGYHVCWAIDHDAAAVETYQENHGGHAIEADIRKTDPAVDGPDIEPGELDLLAGGPPCPSFSTIGRSKLGSLEDRSVDDDDRNVLYLDFLRYVDHFRPRAFVMENVPGMLSDTATVESGTIQESLPVGTEQETERHPVGEEIPIPEIILDEMASLGYTADYFLLDAAQFGVPQHRERLFFVGRRTGETLPDFERWRTHREPHRREREQPMTIRPELKDGDTAQETLGEDHPGSLPSFKPDRKQRQPYLTVADAIMDLPPISPEGEMPPSQATEYTLPPISPYQEWVRNIPDGDCWEDQPLRNHEARWHNHLDLSIYKLLGHGVGWNIGQVSTEIQPYRDDIFPDKYKKQNPAQPASTILAHIQKDGHMYIHPTEARSLSPREAARLQSFRDTYWFPESRTNAYRLIGNAVPPRLGEAVGTAIKEVVLGSDD
ncbi:DNA (cytosine-5)-methyltransferase 1 [Halarchaeum rubridurum]|uniref:DNA (cytosine-5-)-methyltransferase n=1 Tax=Halarchaeum rubridurum TaxID=489911 RepID=A0A830G4H4_9EURY|nr:DNA cytosine methyltransferase [Halarchaeum rubridurum]MBP1955701.1 DNA (cytosine-5)-methyltransferase 1 [Halarchaeum rubridurum]GGM74037.1 restriction endonuclease subunit M [Halarchaeum rubridurum]